MHTRTGLVAAAALTALAGAAHAQHVEVFPTLPHAAINAFPFDMTPGTTMHQVYGAELFNNISRGEPVGITRIAWAPSSCSGTFSGDVVIRMGYTDRIGGQPPPVGLDIPDMAGGGAPNAVGTMEVFYDAPTQHVISNASPENFALIFDGGPFEYDPTRGNLLMEIYITNLTSGFSISRCAGSVEGSRSYHRHSGTTGALATQAHRNEFTFTVGGTQCYPDCDGDGALDFFDFLCFQNAFLAMDPYADCDENGVFDFFDFLCFQNEFLAGCP
jgi:hypothetical protein